MKRIYKGNDAIFNLTSNNYPFNINDINTINFNFYTTNHNDYITKSEKDINEGVLILKWKELETLAEGVLFYDYVLDDGKVTTSEQNTSEYYIVSGSDIDLPRDGKDGATYTPHMDSEGNLSWTNDAGLQNPETINVKGKDGVDGKDGAPGIQGPKGDQGIPGEKGDQGLQGEKGEPGTNGLNGETGPQGPIGPAGPAGPQGPAGKDGVDGKDGETPDMSLYALQSDLVLVQNELNGVVAVADEINGEVI